MSEPRERISRNLRITGEHKAVADLHVAVEEPGGAGDVLIVVTQAYGPRGDNLVGISDVSFDGHPAVTLGVQVGDRRGLVHLSPIHGDSRKAGFTDIPHGAVCELFCPVSGHPLDRVPDVDDDAGTAYFAVYLTPQLSRGSMVMVSNVWGHYHSRIVDNFELISAWADEADAATP